MSKIAVLAMVLGLVAATAGSAFAGGGCGPMTTQSVSIETQTASTGSSDGQVPQTPKPEISN